MDVTNVELYEALLPILGKDAARMIAEIVPPVGNVATRSDIAELRADFAEHRTATHDDIAQLRADFAEHRTATHDDIAQLRSQMDHGFGQVEVRIEEMQARLMRWTLAFFMPLWVAVLAALVAVVLRA